MPPGLDAAFIASLPEPIRWVVIVVVGLGVGFLAIGNYSRKWKQEPEPEVKKDLVLQTASFADMGPVRDVAKYMKLMSEEQQKSRLALEGIFEELREKGKDDEFNRAVDMAVREALARDRGPERPPRAR